MDIAKTFQDWSALLDQLDVDRFLEEFQDESDRAAAVLGAVYLDEALRRLLEKTMAGGDAVVSMLLGRDRPLASFSSRILASVAFGLISPDEHRELELIRRIRNDFAHGQVGLSFSASPVTDRARELMFFKQLSSLAQSSELTPRRQFDLSVIVLWQGLLFRESSAQPFNAASPTYASHRTDGGQTGLLFVPARLPPANQS